ncbi:RidA family protein [Saccharothrix variisporea]|uniref:2-iminobutanoate/2-iminopropanoate deaminase n=1 Tax=Saccharothrix variisporea TaxID=543527 RepID=A0A495X020_9PSEU|nr:RidA family protein [Saccharothrix variisporea]RKT67240.1 2-iminobutanoate/2-iminopropanoate deaminase [Saccharothrix variisporea]
MIEEIVSDRVAKLDLPLPHGVRAGDYVYVSGQIAARPDGSIVVGDFEAETRAVLDNVQAVVEAAGGTLADVCKVTVFLLNATLFEPMNRVYAEYFTAPYPARSTVLAPLSNPDLRIEIEAVAYLPRR